GDGGVAFESDGTLAGGGFTLGVFEFAAEGGLALEVVVELTLKAGGVGGEGVAIEDEVAQAGDAEEEAIEAGHREVRGAPPARLPALRARLPAPHGCCWVREWGVPKPRARSTAGVAGSGGGGHSAVRNRKARRGVG